MAFVCYPSAFSSQTFLRSSQVLPMAVGIFLCAMDGTIVVSSAAAIGSELNELQNTSWIATAYLLTLTSFQPLYGKLSDIFGRKSCLLFSYSIFSIGCLLCGLSRNMNELIMCRAFAGIGGGGMQPIVSIIMSDVVPLRSRGTWQGVLNIVWTTGTIVGASLGGLFADTIGWRWAFLIQVPIALIAIIAVSLALHLPKVESGGYKAKLKRVDFLGAISLVSAVFFLLFGLDRGGNVSWNDKLTIYSLCAFFVAFVTFAFVEMKWASEPFAPKRIIVNRSLISSYLVNFFGIASGFTMIFYIALYFQAVQGRSASEAGIWLLFSVGGSLTGSLCGGLIIQATGKYYLLTLASYIVFFLGTTSTTLSSGVIVTSSVGIASGDGITTSLISLIANAGQADQAIATAVSYLFRSLGSVVGLSVGATLVQGTLRSSLQHKLSGQDVDEIIRRVRESLSYLDELDPVTRATVTTSYGEAIHVAFWFSAIMAACAMISAIFIKEKPIPAKTT
ncbi:member of the major facilitator superfamily [Laccaria bicolor S238N-H82]|uniref:Member of the major facilitator superfamily n=1 Tax=Laccaria bicolor (strain S238N-H82 / ATCC MYA-4686) TaxID=486041 RepID=B0DFL5_LACBS|nr:member of the major facilitator superfamily [Laccaria bicolor S238N-H82]EDR06887.1 member of the major facilitator superfamily [Laccaria bicolor S238N-H82]|eukprot:XP_001882734.1 member of the major facilitator superfamily [Laccaria bicolor S238N-H82]